MSTSSEGSADRNLEGQEGLERIDSMASSKHAGDEQPSEEVSAPGFPTTAAVPAAAAAAAADTAASDDDNDDDTNGNGTKRPLMTHTKDGKLLSEKKRRRLEKNRLSARECRRRKKQSAENVQREIVVLESENLRLRLQLQIGEEAEDSLHKEQTKLTEDMDALLKSGASEAEIYATIEEFKEKFADYGRDRRSAIEFHLRNIERLLMPTKTTTFVMRAIQGGSQQTDETPVFAGSNVKPASTESAASPVSTPSVASAESTEPVRDTNEPDPSLEPKELFQYLVNHLEVNPAQAAALKDSRLIAQEMDGCLEKALAVLAELRTRLAQTGEDLETEFTNVRSILSPTQAAKFLVWVANNSACIHMLNELWDRVYPAQDGAAVAGECI
jgi:hypothetical protein